MEKYLFEGKFDAMNIFLSIHRIRKLPSIFIQRLEYALLPNVQCMVAGLDNRYLK